MAPTAEPMKIKATQMSFLVVPPTFPESSERQRTETALDEPVR